MGLVLEGHTALVTGANGGLGAHFARTLSRAGAAVALCARRVDSLDQVAQAIMGSGGRASAVALDVTKRDSVVQAFVRAAEALGPVTVAVNNAGIAVTKPLLEHTEEDWRSVVDVNLNGAWRIAQAAARHMVAHKQGGASSTSHRSSACASRRRCRATSRRKRRSFISPRRWRSSSRATGYA